MCGKPGILMCRECDREYPREQAHYFCRQCFADWHGNPSRLNHRPILRESENDDIGRLQLLSVICIESSHYVCFTRLKGSGTNEWVFFDSMAEKQGNWLASSHKWTDNVVLKVCRIAKYLCKIVITNSPTAKTYR